MAEIKIDQQQMTMTVSKKVEDQNNNDNGQNAAKKRTVDQWLGEVLRVELVDGRVIFGRFVCTDRAPNIVLTDSREFWKFKEQKAGGKLDRERVPVRNIGMVMIKGEHINRILHVQPSEEVRKEMLTAWTVPAKSTITMEDNINNGEKTVDELAPSSTS